MDTNVVKILEMRLEIEILDWTFNSLDRSLDIDYTKNGKLKSYHFTREQLLEELDKSFMIDGFRDEEVKFSYLAEEFIDGGLRQRRHENQVSLVEFMNERFDSDGAYRLMKYHEDQLKIKREAKFFADKMRRTIQHLH